MYTYIQSSTRASSIIRTRPKQQQSSYSSTYISAMPCPPAIREDVSTHELLMGSASKLSYLQELVFPLCTIMILGPSNPRVLISLFLFGSSSSTSIDLVVFYWVLLIHENYSRCFLLGPPDPRVLISLFLFGFS